MVSVVRVLATSEGFLGVYERSGFGLSTAVIAGEGTARSDAAYHSATYFEDLKAPEVIGQEAGDRAVRRLGAVNLKQAHTSYCI